MDSHQDHPAESAVLSVFHYALILTGLLLCILLTWRAGRHIEQIYGVDTFQYSAAVAEESCDPVVEEYGRDLCCATGIEAQREPHSVIGYGTMS